MDMLCFGEIGIPEFEEGLLHRIKGIPLTGQDAELDDYVKFLWQGLYRLLGYRLEVVDLSVDRQGSNCHPIFSQRSGFIDAQYGGGTKRLDHRNMSCQDIDLRQTPRSQGKEDRQDDREFFRQHCHRQSNTRKDPLEPISASDSVHDDKDGT